IPFKRYIFCEVLVKKAICLFFIDGFVNLSALL
ncbi:hypothetical protein SAMN05720764_1582, partial [Fibrobacter sp. UWH5]